MAVRIDVGVGVDLHDGFGQVRTPVAQALDEGAAQ
jgi:hypothetical protein